MQNILTKHTQVDMIEFELFKDCREAKMELTISPVTFLFADGCKRPTRDMHLSHGFMQLQGVQVAMCGLYSGVGESGETGRRVLSHYYRC